MLLLLQFEVVTLMSLSSIDPAKMSMAISASSQDVKSKLKDHDNFDSKDHNVATNHVLAFLWCHHKNFPSPLQH